MQYYRSFMETFGIPEDVLDRVISVRVKDHYYWAVQHEGALVTVSCAADRNHLYDGNDATLSEQLVTDEELFFENKEIDQTLVVQAFSAKHDPTSVVYIVTSLRDLRCVYNR